MEANLDGTATGAGRPAYRTRSTTAATVGKQRPADGSTAAAAAEGTVTDYLTSSLGRYKGGGPGGALPADRYRGHRLRCKAVLRSNMPNDKGREVRVVFWRIFCDERCWLLFVIDTVESSGHGALVKNWLMRSWLILRRAPNSRPNLSTSAPSFLLSYPLLERFTTLTPVCNHVRLGLEHLDGVRAAAAQRRASWGAIPGKGQTPKTWGKQQVRRNRTEPPRYVKGPSAKRYPLAPTLAKRKY